MGELREVPKFDSRVEKALASRMVSPSGSAADGGYDSKR
jgi:hypothetical protein